jgi:hypothetical protein
MKSYGVVNNFNGMYFIPGFVRIGHVVQKSEIHGAVANIEYTPP